MLHANLKLNLRRRRAVARRSLLVTIETGFAEIVERFVGLIPRWIYMKFGQRTQNHLDSTLG